MFIHQVCCVLFIPGLLWSMDHICCPMYHCVRRESLLPPKHLSLQQSGIPGGHIHSLCYLCFLLFNYFHGVEEKLQEQDPKINWWRWSSSLRSYKGRSQSWGMCSDSFLGFKWRLSENDQKVDLILQFLEKKNSKSITIICLEWNLRENELVMNIIDCFIYPTEYFATSLYIRTNFLIVSSFSPNSTKYRISTHIEFSYCLIRLSIPISFLQIVSFLEVGTEDSCSIYALLASILDV